MITLISDQEMIEVLETTEEQLRQAEAKERPWLEQVAGKMFYEPGWLIDQAKRGNYKTATINLDGSPAYVVFYSTNDQNWLVINCFTALRPASLDQAQKALETIARREGCQFIQVDTKVQTMFRVCRRLGYEAMGVILLKKLDENPA
jgi:hypothetical protein